MRWNSSGIAYPRPLRWIVALYGERVIPFAFAGVVSSRTSRVARYADAAAGLEAGEFTTFDVAGGADYFAAVTAQGVVVNGRSVAAALIDQSCPGCRRPGQRLRTRDPDLLDEVTDLVESPQALLGRFEDKYLELPMPVLIGVMKKHQRYFPVLRDGQMLPYFITVANARAPGPARCGDGRQRRRDPLATPMRPISTGRIRPATLDSFTRVWARLPSMSGLAPCSTRWSV